MKLTDLEPRWFVVGLNASENDRHGMTFECPHCVGSAEPRRLAITLHLDGTNFDPDPANPQQFATGETVWKIEGGDTFANISLSPSVDASASGHWHGHILNGEIVGGI